MIEIDASKIPDEPIVIETHNLSKRYKDVQSVDNLNMKVQKGEIFGFLGPNGAGKTTTIKMVMSLCPAFVDDGAIDISLLFL